MRCMVLIKASPQSEAGEMPSEALMAAMGQFNQALLDAGVLVDGGGLKATSVAARVRMSDAGTQVEQGPFLPCTEQVAGYWLWQVASLDEAIEWARRCPLPMPDEATLEIRPLYEMEDFATASAEVREQEQRLAARLAEVTR